MEPRDRLANLGLLVAAVVSWILVAVLVTTRDPYQDAMAGYIGALLIGLAVGVTAVPLCWLIVFARHRRIAYQGDWFRATRRGGWVGLFVASLVVLRLVDAFQPAIVVFLARHLRRRRAHALRGAKLTAHGRRARHAATDTMPSMTDTIPAARPAEPFADLKARAAAAVEDARDEIIDLSHRIHANPEPAFEEHQASAWVAEASRDTGTRWSALSAASTPRSAAA